jgi:allophanate hydrolase
VTTASERVRAAYALNASLAPKGVWIVLLPEADALALAAEVDRRVRGGESLPLAGLVGAVKDNIDILGTPTTAGCPAFSYLPDRDATVAARLVEAGLVLIGKTNLDQFATGLVGTRSPYGAPASVSEPTRISGGSSSGSAVAVSLGIVDLALGTDTAGSGRVPAAFNGIVGFKPTRGLVPVTGVVPASPSFDCVSVFARSVALATQTIAVLGGLDGEDSFGRPWPPDARRGLPPRPSVAIPGEEVLSSLDSTRTEAFSVAVERLVSLGVEVRSVDMAALLEAGTRLYGSALVAERYSSVGRFIDANPASVDPVVGRIISGANSYSAAELVDEALALGRSRLLSARMFEEFDALMLPTVAEHPTFDEVAADPIGVNARLGRFTTFCNLLDCAAIAVPLPARGDVSASTFGVSFFASAFGDQVVADLGALLLGEAPPPSVTRTPGARLVVVGAHLSGQPLNDQLTRKGARLVTTTTTSPSYRLFSLDTVPPKPGLVRASPADGAAIEVEVWELSPASFAAFVDDIVPPLALGKVELVDASTLPGFILGAVDGPIDAEEITRFGGWRSYLEAKRR